MTALPNRATIAGSPDNATAKAYFAAQWDFLVELLGQDGAIATMRSTSRNYDAGTLSNIGLAASVGANALTIALKGADGNDPSATNPVLVGMRSATVTSGNTNLRSATAAQSITIPSTATMGQSNAVAARLWVALIDNAGTLELAVINTQLGSGQIHPVNESGLISTTALGTGSDSAGVWYSTSARSNVPFRLIGYIENTQATAGTWATTPSVIQPMGPGVRRPGEVVQRVRTNYGSAATGTTTIPGDNTTPQITEGDQYMSQAVTPTSAINALGVTCSAHHSNSASVGMISALFQTGTSDALAVTLQHPSGAGTTIRNEISHRRVAGSASALTFTMRSGGSGAGTTTFNGSGGGSVFNGTYNSYMEIEEVMA